MRGRLAPGGFFSVSSAARWQRAGMTDTPDNTSDDTMASADDANGSDSPKPAVEPVTAATEPVRDARTRTKRILIIALSGGAAALIVVIAFGLGVLVGSEYGGDGKRDDGVAVSEYVDEHHGEPHERDRPEYDAHRGDERESVGAGAEQPDQPAGPGVRGSSTVAPTPVPSAPR